PITTEGEAKPSQNGKNHGMTSRNTCILEHESADEFKAFLDEHTAIHCHPSTPPSPRKGAGRADGDRPLAHSPLHRCGSRPHESCCLSLISRYEARHQRVHDKAHATLLESQRSRAGSPSVSTGTSPRSQNLAKRTQRSSALF